MSGGIRLAPPPRFRWKIFPRKYRFPKRVRDWWRVGALLVALILVIGLVPLAKFVIPRIGCIPGTMPTGSVWKEGGECVGVTDTTYDFGQSDLGEVMEHIGHQNGRSRDGACKADIPAVKIGALVTSSSPEVGKGMVDQLKGIAAAQAQANDGDCVRPVRLLVGQAGRDGQAASQVAGRLADEGAVAVVGMGLSRLWAAQAAAVLGKKHIPMVGAVLTGEGFDRDGSRADRPDYGNCRDAKQYRNGVGDGRFYRVSYRNKVQIDEIAKHVPEGGKLDFIVTPTNDDDPYTCTMLPLLHKKFGKRVQEVRFDTADEVTVGESAKRICSEKGNVNVFYAARAHQLSHFMEQLGSKFSGGYCDIRTLTVVSTSDAARIRAGAENGTSWPGLESKAFRSGKINLLYTPLADPDIPLKGDPNSIAGLRKWLDDNGFHARALDSGWAISGFDAMSTVTQAVDAISARQSTVTGPQIDTRIGTFSERDPVRGAGGRITFGNDGNRNDARPTVVSLCPPAGSGSRAPKTVNASQGREACP